MIPEWITRYAHEPVAMTHGDFRLDNLFFVADGSVAVIDWHSPATSRPFTTAVSRAMR